MVSVEIVFTDWFFTLPDKKKRNILLKCYSVSLTLRMQKNNDFVSILKLFLKVVVVVLAIKELNIQALFYRLEKHTFGVEHTNTEQYITEQIFYSLAELKKIFHSTFTILLDFNICTK